MADAQEIQQNNTVAAPLNPLQPSFLPSQDATDGQQPGDATIGDTAAGAQLQELRRRQQVSAQQDAQAQADQEKSRQDMEQKNKDAVAAKATHLRTIGQNALKAAGTMLSHLGDVGNIGKVPEGAGGLYGAAKTLQGRQERGMKEQQFAEEQRKDSATIAEANIRTRTAEQALHRLDEEDRLKAQDRNSVAMNMLRKAGVPVLLEKGHSDQVMQNLQNKTINPAQHLAVPDGSTPEGDGSRGTYSIVVPQDVTIPKDNPTQEQTDFLNWMNRYAPREDGGKWQPGQTFTKDSLAHYLSVANQNQMIEASADAYLTKNDLVKAENLKVAEALKFEREDADMLSKALNQTNGDIIAARNLLMRQNPTKWKDLDYDLAQHFDRYGKDFYGEILKKHQDKLDIASTQFEDRRKELTSADGPKAAGLAEQWRTELQNNDIPTEYRPTLQRMINEADAKAKGASSYAVDLKSRESEAEQKANEGDLSSVMDMALHYEYDPDKLFSRFKGQKQKAEFLAEMHRRDPNWSEAQYNARFKTVADYRPQGEGGKAVQALGTFAGHAEDANGLIQNLRNSKSPLLNTPLNKFKTEVLGSPEFIKYKTAIAAAADNYISFLLNNHAKHESDDKLAEKLQSENLAPDQAQGLLRQMANTIAIKAREQNRTYKTTMKTDIPDFMGPETQRALRTFGIDPKSITVGEGDLPPGVIDTIKNANGGIVDFGENGKWKWEGNRPVRVPSGQ